MRWLALIIALALMPGVAAPEPARAQETGPSIGDEVDPTTPASKAERIDLLFETLKTSEDRRLAEEAERAILELWHESGSDTVDLLMSWALDAMEDKRYARALDFLDRVVVMEPGYVEGWNKRATVYFLMDDYSRSIADIGRVLEIEARHFGALSGFGIIMRSLGEKERAIVAYERALAVNPYLEGAHEALDELKAETRGEAI
jgi:tetratricopeptide (TPR) repeat protein